MLKGGGSIEWIWEWAGTWTTSYELAQWTYDISREFTTYQTIPLVWLEIGKYLWKSHYLAPYQYEPNTPSQFKKPLLSLNIVGIHFLINILYTHLCFFTNFELHFLYLSISKLFSPYISPNIVGHIFFNIYPPIWTHMVWYFSPSENLVHRTFSLHSYRIPSTFISLPSWP